MAGAAVVRTSVNETMLLPSRRISCLAGLASTLLEFLSCGTSKNGYKERTSESTIMKLIVQPDAGVAPIIKAIKRARRTLALLIFRLGNDAIAEALQAAVKRGVDVRALTAHANRGGNKKLRKLELQLLDGGVTVSRTADNLVRYHGKM